jgi:hypothetical protein
MDYHFSKRSSSNFAKKMGFGPILPKHKIRSKRTQEAIQESQEFYKDNVENQKLLLEQQIAYKQKEAMRLPVEKPSNVITLKNGTQWYFDKNLNKFVNVITKEELTVIEFNTYVAMLGLEQIEFEEDFDNDAGLVEKVEISAHAQSNGFIAGTDTVYASATVLQGSVVSYEYEWYYEEVDHSV